jgi:hypothetical protein
MWPFMSRSIDLKKNFPCSSVAPGNTAPRTYTRARTRTHTQRTAPTWAREKGRGRRTLGEGLHELVAGDGAVVVRVEPVKVLLDGVGRHRRQLVPVDHHLLLQLLLLLRRL